MIRTLFKTLVFLSLFNINCTFAQKEDESDKQLKLIPLRLLGSPDLEKQLEDQVGRIQTRDLEKDEDNSLLLGSSSRRKSSRYEVMLCTAPIPFVSFAGALLIMAYEPIEWRSMLSASGLFLMSIFSTLKLIYDCNGNDVILTQGLMDVPL